VETRGLHGRKAGLSTPWKNIAAIRLEPRGAEGLILKEPLEGHAAERLARFRGMRVNGAPLYDEEKRLLLGEGRYFPIEVFAHWIRHGDLWEQIREHAPWLADAQGQPVAYSPRSPVEPWTWKKTAWLVTIVTLLFGLGILLSVMPPRAQAIAFHSVSGILGVCMAVYGLNNLWAGTAHLRRKHFLEGGLWLAMGIIQVLLAMSIFGEIVGPRR
jgi:hypothetical protein